jgi:hypothetical protein
MIAPIGKNPVRIVWSFGSVLSRFQGCRLHAIVAKMHKEIIEK